MGEPKTKAKSKRENFVVAGWRELGRKIDRFKLRRKLRRHNEERNFALVALGQRAWEERIDLTAFADLESQLRGLDDRAAKLSETGEKLQSEKSRLESERKAEVEKFAAQCHVVQKKKDEIDSALRASRSRKAECSQTIRQADSRLTALPNKLSALEQQIAMDSASALPDQQQRLETAKEECTRLTLEQSQLQAKLATAQRELPQLTAEESRLAGESQRYAVEIAAIEAERKSVLKGLDSELARVQSESQGTSRESNAVQQERTEKFKILGQSLYDSGIHAPVIEECVGRVAIIDQSRAAIGAELRVSVTQSQSLTTGTMVKFWSVSVCLPVALFVLSVGFYYSSRLSSTLYQYHLRGLSAAGLAKEVATADHLWKSLAATMEALARGGVATTDLNKTIVQPYSPAAHFVAIPPEVLQLSVEARRPGGPNRLTIGQFARMLADFGWPYSNDASPAQQMIKLLSRLISGARQKTNDPDSYVWLFLDESAKLKRPSVDLASGNADPEQAGFSLLEMQLFAAAFGRTAKILSPLEKPIGHRFGSFEAPGFVSPAYGAEPSSPCANLQEWLGPLGDEARGQVVDRASDKLIELAFPAGKEAISAGLDALDIVMRLQKAWALYSNREVAVTADKASVHKPNETTPPTHVVFTARAGVSEKEWKDYQDTYGRDVIRTTTQFQDCLTTMNLPTYTDLAAVAADAQNWYVAWEIRPSAESPHFNITPGGTHPAEDENVFEFPGMKQNRLVRSSDTSAETQLRVHINEERRIDHDSGIEKSITIKVCALLKTAKPPSLGTFIAGAAGGVGLATSLGDLALGWQQTMFPLESCAPLEITYHDPGEGGTITLKESVPPYKEDLGQVTRTFQYEKTQIFDLSFNEHLAVNDMLAELREQNKIEEKNGKSPSEYRSETLHGTVTTTIETNTIEQSTGSCSELFARKQLSGTESKPVSVTIEYYLDGHYEIPLAVEDQVVKGTFSGEEFHREACGKESSPHLLSSTWRKTSMPPQSISESLGRTSMTLWGVLDNQRPKVLSGTGTAKSRMGPGSITATWELRKK